MSALRDGIARLDATRCGRTRWAYYDDAMSRWYVADSEDVRDAGRMAPWDYSVWCAATLSEAPTIDDARGAARNGTTVEVWL